MSSRDLNLIDPELRRRVHLIDLEWRRTLEPIHHRRLFISEGWRSKERQEQLWEQGRTTPGPQRTWAKPGQSLHEYGLAIDWAFADPVAGGCDWSEDLFEALGPVIRKYGMDWGGDWGTYPKGRRDRPHCEAPGITWKQARDGIEPDWPPLPTDPEVDPAPLLAPRPRYA